MWVILPNNADWDCFKTPILREILRIQNLLLEEHCAFFGSHTFVPISWMCKKQTSVSHSSTESEIISLDAGLRLDGIPALDLWDLVVSVLGNVTQTHDRTVRPIITEKSQKYQGKTNLLNNIDCVPSNVQSSHQEALLYLFEDNEAVIKIHRVALDWLFDRINLDPKIQIKYIDTKSQLADILTTLKQWGNDLNTIQEKNESQQNRDQ